MVPGREKQVSSARVSAEIGSTLRADLLLSNGNIITLDSVSSTSEAVAIRGSKIVAVGKTADLEARVALGPNADKFQGQPRSCPGSCHPPPVTWELRERIKEPLGR